MSHPLSPSVSLPLSPPSLPSLPSSPQIHAEAQAEEAAQKELIQQHQHGMMAPMKQGGRGDDKRGRGRDREGKGGPDEWNKVERDREKRDRDRERDKPKVDTNRIRGLTKRGEKPKEVRTVLCKCMCCHNYGEL